MSYYLFTSQTLRAYIYIYICDDLISFINAIKGSYQAESNAVNYKFGTLFPTFLFIYISILLAVYVLVLNLLRIQGIRKNVTDLIRWANADFKKTSTVACAVKQALCLV